MQLTESVRFKAVLQRGNRVARATEVLNTISVEFQLMPTSNSKKPKAHARAKHAVLKPEITDLDVLEWLESERLEHEKRMQGLGCSLLSMRKESVLDSQKDVDISQNRR